MPDELEPKLTAAQEFSRAIEEVWLGKGTRQEKREKAMALSKTYLESLNPVTEPRKMAGVGIPGSQT